MPGASILIYCVDIVDSMWTRLHSSCQFNSTELMFPLPSQLVCREFNFSVTPENAAGKGPTSTVSISHSSSTSEGVMTPPVLTEAVQILNITLIVMVSHHC